MKAIPLNKSYYISENWIIFNGVKKISSWKSNKWYLMVDLHDEWIRRKHLVHRLVAITYIPNPNNYPIVLHLDNDPLNNHVSNLRWWTQKQNIQQAHNQGRCPRTEKMIQAQKISIRKAQNKKSKPIMQLTREWILCKIYDSTREAQRITGICHQNISRCAKWNAEYTWGYWWKYLIK